MTDIDTATPPIGIVVVHGIGAQKPGDTVGKLLAGLQRVDPQFAPNGHDGLLALGGRPVRLYEVYWADLLMGQLSTGAFQMKELQSLSWFPFFNLVRGNYGRGRYGVLKLTWWCVILPIVNFFTLAAYFGTAFVAQLVRSFRGMSQEPEDGGSLLDRAKKAAERTTRRTMVDEILDEYVGDVLSYVNSAGSAFFREGDEPAVPAAVESSYAQIVRRFYDQLLRAQADGCSAIHIVAHSLGTVVTYHALSGLRFEGDGHDAPAIRSALAKVTNLYTIGSPLEKIRFFWPRLTTAGALLCGKKIQWDNFVSWFDPVAGSLRGFAGCGNVTNHRLLGGGFLRGHVVYEHSGVFLRALTRGVTGREIDLVRTRKERWWDLLVLAGETLLTPAVAILILLLGAALVTATALFIPYLLSWVLRPFMKPATWGPIVDVASWIFAGAMFLTFVIVPLTRAYQVHARYWVIPRPGGDEIGGTPESAG